MKELLLTRSFLRSQTGRGIHSSFLISAAAVALGVTFLILTVGVYDSYVKKLETITFSVYPHILVLDERTAAGNGEAASSGPVAAWTDAERCQRICAGQTILNPQAAGANGTRRAALARLADLRSTLGSETSSLHAAPMIMEERDFRCRFERQQSAVEEVRTLRIFGIDPRADRIVPQVDLFLPDGLLDRLEGEGAPVILSRDLARSLFGSEDAVGRTITVDRPGTSAMTLTVVGSFALGFHTISGNMVIASIATAQAVMEMEGEASYFGITLEDPYRSQSTLERLRGSLRRSSFNASDWMSIAAGDFQSIRLFRWILFLVLGMSFVITGLSIRNTLSILTLERRRQIGILRALGLRDASIRGVFLLLALAIGVSGSLFGLVCGSWLSLGFGRWLDRELAGILPIHGVEMTFHPAAMVQVLALVLLVCAVTALVAVRRALDLDPVHCLIEE